MFQIHRLPLALVKPTAGIQTDPLVYVLLELLVRPCSQSTVVVQILHLMSLLTQPSRCCSMLAVAPLPSAVSLVGALVSSSKAARQAQCCGSQVKAMARLLLEVAKHTLQLVDLMQSSNSGSGGGNAGVVGDEVGDSGLALDVPAASADNPAAAAAGGGLPLQEQQQQQGVLGTGREERRSALIWAACHLVQSAEAVGKDVELGGCLLQDAEEVKQLLQALQVNGVCSEGSRPASSSSSSSNSSSSTRRCRCTSKRNSKLNTSSERSCSSATCTSNTCPGTLEPNHSACSKGPWAECAAELAGKVMASLSQSWCCSSPQCGTLQGPSELGMVLAGVCGGCKSVAYCSRRCQELHWPQHRKNCMDSYMQS